MARRALAVLNTVIGRKYLPNFSCLFYDTLPSMYCVQAQL